MCYYVLAGNLFYWWFLFRYIYVPLGGSKNVILNTVLVFSFVALWHDLTFRLLAWGWLVSLFVIPELAASYLLSANKVYFSLSHPSLLIIYTPLVREISMVSTYLCCWRCLEHCHDDDCQSRWICCRHWRCCIPCITIVWNLGWCSIYGYSWNLFVRWSSTNVWVSVCCFPPFRTSRMSINLLRYFREEELRQGIQRRS